VDTDQLLDNSTDDHLFDHPHIWIEGDYNVRRYGEKTPRYGKTG
jgi:hypothetical protein